MLTFHIVTLFPDAFSYLSESILGRAQKQKKIKIKFYNPRDFIKKKDGAYKAVDDRPYGGGPGMVMKAEPILKAVARAVGKKKAKIIFFSAGGKQFIGKDAVVLSKQYKDIVLIAGHYEGVDERVARILKAHKFSVGPYVLTGGELPAMVAIDAISRHVKGVLGTHESLEESRVASSEVYTRPEVLEYKKKNYRVPKVLLSGDHKKIESWRQKRGRASV